MSADSPLVSVVVLTRNGGEPLKQLMRAVFSQKTEGFNFEVVVMDSGSKDAELSFLRSLPVSFYQIEAKDFSFGPTRDLAFGHARGSYIATLSQDVVPANESWLHNLIEPLWAGRADIVQGHNIVPQDRSVFFWERKRLFYFTSEEKDFIKAHGGISLSCTNIAMKREVWDAVRFGPTPMSEDKMFQMRAHAKGFRMVSNKEAVAYHGHSYTLTSLVKRCENEGLGWRKVGVVYSLRQALRDALKFWLYGVLVRGFLKREIKSFGEALYLFIRPIFLFKGNHFNTSFRF